MSLTVNIGFALAIALLVVCIWRHRPPRRPALETRIAAARKRTGLHRPDRHDVGPDSLRLLEDLDTHLKAYAEAVADYYDTTTGDR